MLTSAVEQPRPRFRLLFGVAIGACATAAIVTTCFDEAAPPPPAPIVTVVPPGPQPVVVPITVSTPPPPPPVVIAPPAPPEPDPIPPRALAPILHAPCIGLGYETSEPDVACSWDDGFPAISHDGKTVVVQRSDDDGGRGYPSLYIDFIDVATSEVKRTIKVLSPDEFDPDEDKHRPKVVRRVAAAQKAIDAIGFRSLVELVGEGESSSTKLRVEAENGSIRVIDPERAVAIFQGSFSGPAAFPRMKGDPDSGCGFPSASQSSAAWDEETRIVVVTVQYVFGGCLCGGDSMTYVRRAR